MCCSGHPGDPPLHTNLKLVIWQHILPHDNRQPGAGVKAAMRDIAGLQDGRSAHLIHLTHADQYEQATGHSTDQVEPLSCPAISEMKLSSTYLRKACSFDRHTESSAFLIPIAAPLDSR